MIVINIIKMLSSYYRSVLGGALIGSIAFRATDALKVGHISDLHLEIKYDPSLGKGPDNKGSCSMNEGFEADTNAPMGRYGCDSPMILLETMLQEFNESHGKQDVIIFTGDMASHYTAMDIDDLPSRKKETYSLLMATHSGITQLLTKYFPDTIILPMIGNNDNLYHDNP